MRAPACVGITRARLALQKDAVVTLNGKEYDLHNQVFAVKCIKKTAELKEDEIVSLKEEVQVLKMVDHPNIIKLYEFIEEPKMFYMVTELMEGGELFDRIVTKTFYNEKEARDLVKILLGALE